jgi:flagellar basal-body rod modification protein FlgD
MVTATSATSNNASSLLAGTGSGALDKNAFLNLLVTQMQYQDPMKPMEDAQFIAQLAQFSALEQMQQVNSNLSLMQQMEAVSQASGLVGKHITYLDSTGNQSASSLVDRIELMNGSITLIVNGVEVSPSNVMTILP